MKKYLKYDLISNKKFFSSTFLVFAILLFAILSVRVLGSLNRLIEINSALYALEIIFGLVLLMVLIAFIFSTYYKDFYSKRSILTFSLPLSFRDIIMSKILVINLFYLLMALFTIFLSYIVADRQSRLLVDLLFLLFILANYLSQLILFAIFVDRFKNQRLQAFLLLLIFPLSIIILILFRSLGEKEGFFDLFTYGYFFVLAICLFFINQKYIRENFDLS
ncbi:MAG: hypothetical protein PUG67_07645 [Peptoniphilaceae bacterium]|nr:hypothetical protein [Peptoniphilaceae bacterium]MDY6019318.1 hypothetical protein [Anaerococcus sp.]